MNPRTYVVFSLTVAVGMLAHTLCFEDTTIGGYLPWLLLTAGPLLGAGAVHLGDWLEGLK